jgi:hypothetical protein
MSFKSKALAVIALTCGFVGNALGHGLIQDPPSRNWFPMKSALVNPLTPNVRALLPTISTVVTAL